MNSNMTVGPSFQGAFQLLTVEKLVEGRPVYRKRKRTIQINNAQDLAINNGLAYLLAGNLKKPVIVAADRLDSTLKYISTLIKKPLDYWFKPGETVAFGDLFNPKGMHFELKTTQPKPGDMHLFWDSESQFDTSRVDISLDDIVALVKETRFGSGRKERGVCHLNSAHSTSQTASSA